MPSVPSPNLQLRAVLSADELADRELEAYAALGAAQLAAANLEGASECLDEITHAGDVDSRLLAEAHEALGIIHAQKGRMAEAVRFLDAAFQNRQELQSTEFADRKRLDKVGAAARCRVSAACCAAQLARVTLCDGMTTDSLYPPCLVPALPVITSCSCGCCWDSFAPSLSSAATLRRLWAAIWRGCWSGSAPGAGRSQQLPVRAHELSCTTHLMSGWRTLWSTWLEYVVASCRTPPGHH